MTVALSRRILLLAAALDLACSDPTGPNLRTEELLYHSFHDGGLHLIRGDGSHDRVLWSSSSDGATCPSWAPDGSALAFQVLPSNQIAVVDANTKAVRTLTTDPSWHVCPMWSPDGSHLAYLAGPATAPEGFGLYLYALATGRIDTLASTGFVADRGAWTPDGQTILAVRLTGTLARIDATTGIESAGPLWTISDRAPAYSPAGDLIAYSCQPGSSPTICLMSEDGTGQHQLTSSRAGIDWADGYPTWVPNSHIITFQRYSPGPVPGFPRATIHLLGTDGREIAWPGNIELEGDQPLWRP